MSYKIQMERGPEEAKIDTGPAWVDPLTRAERLAEDRKNNAAMAQSLAEAKARALDDALCQQELIRSGRSILACQFIRDSAKVQGVTLREFINREPF